jgi:hypothetical protein
MLELFVSIAILLFLLTVQCIMGDKQPNIKYKGTQLKTNAHLKRGGILWRCNACWAV